MPRLFSYANVAALAEGESCVVNDSVSTVKRKCALYGARNGKRFEVRNNNSPDARVIEATVTRLPITDTELPAVEFPRVALP